MNWMGKKLPMKFGVVLLVVLVAVVSVAAAFMMNHNAPLTDENDEKGIRIGLYYDTGAHDPYPHMSMLVAAGCDVAVIDSSFINTQSLDDFSIIAFPGGNPLTWAVDIYPTGKEKIRDFVRNGGGYIGIGGGADFASEKVVWLGKCQNFTFLELFKGIAKSPNPEIAWPATTQINIINFTHPITLGGPTTYQMHYSGGPFFTPNADVNPTPLANYEVGNHLAMMALEYGDGRVFLIGTRPEENSGPNWELMSRVVLWLTED